jgi:hypothetical protein
MESAWGVEHGSPITKSLVGQNKFVPAVKLGARRLKAARKRMATDDRWAPQKSASPLRRKLVEDAPKKQDMSYPLPGNRKAGAYGRRGDARTDVVREVHTEVNGALSELKGQATRTTAFQSKSGKKYKVSVVPGYPNAHPIRTGSKKRGKTEIVTGEKQMNASVMRHEVMHGDGKSSWRLSQIGSRSRSLKREEARADTLSGTYKQNKPRDFVDNMGAVSHTAGNRIGQNRSAREFRRTQDQIFRGQGKSPRKESARSGVPYVPTPGKANASGAQRTRRYLVAGAAGGGAAAGGSYGKRKYERDRNGKFS